MSWLTQRPDSTPFASSVLPERGNQLTRLHSVTEVSTAPAARLWSPLPTDLQAVQREIWSECLSKDTLRAYATRKRKWLEFCEQYQRLPRDLSPRNIVDYITFLASIGNKGAPFAYSSIKVYVDFLGRALSFTSPDRSNPVQHPEVQLFLRGTARRLGKKVDKAEPCTPDHLRAVSRHAMSHPTDPEAQVVAMIALLAFWGCLRLGSLIPKSPDKMASALTFGDVELRNTSLILSVRVSKTIRFAERVHRVEIPAQADPLLCPLRAFARWTLLLQPRSSRMPLSALSTTSHALLSHSRFLGVVNALTHPCPPLTGHSFRRGYVRLAFIRGVPIWQIMHHGDWKTLEVAMSYAEDVLIPNPLGGV